MHTHDRGHEPDEARHASRTAARPGEARNNKNHLFIISKMYYSLLPFTYY